MFIIFNGGALMQTEEQKSMQMLPRGMPSGCKCATGRALFTRRERKVCVCVDISRSRPGAVSIRRE